MSKQANEKTPTNNSPVYVYSTLSGKHNFEQHDPEAVKAASLFGGRPSTPLRTVTILGGANQRGKNVIITPKGIATKIRADEYEWLKEDAQFKRFVDRGFIVVSTKEEKADNIAKDMTAFDGSAPQNIKLKKGMKLVDHQGED